MHAGSRICLGKLRMSTCEGPVEDCAPPFFDPRTRNARVSRPARVHRGCTTPRLARKVPPRPLCSDIRHGVLLGACRTISFSNCVSLGEIHSCCTYPHSVILKIVTRRLRNCYSCLSNFRYFIYTNFQ